MGNAELNQRHGRKKFGHQEELEMVWDGAPL